MGLKSLRLKRGLTQKQLAERIGVTRGYVAQFETGVSDINNITLANAVKLCDALKVSNPRKLLEPDE